MSENWQSKPVKASHQMRRFIIYVALLVLAFLAGLVPMWLSSRECSSSLADGERRSSLARMENSLGSAAIDAQRGDYETARQAAVAFLLPYGRKRVMALSRPSRRQKLQACSRC